MHQNTVGARYKRILGVFGAQGTCVVAASIVHPAVEGAKSAPKSISFM